MVAPSWSRPSMSMALSPPTMKSNGSGSQRPSMLLRTKRSTCAQLAWTGRLVPSTAGVITLILWSLHPMVAARLRPWPLSLCRIQQVFCSLEEPLLGEVISLKLPCQTKLGNSVWLTRAVLSLNITQTVKK